MNVDEDVQLGCHHQCSRAGRRSISNVQAEECCWARKSHVFAICGGRRACKQAHHSQQVRTKGRNGVSIGEEARRGGGAIRTAPLGKRLPAGIPRYLSAASDSIRPSTITWLTWIDFGPYSLATDCWAHDVRRSGGKRMSATRLVPIGKQGR